MRKTCVLRMDELCDFFREDYPIDRFPKEIKVGEAFTEKEVGLLRPYITPPASTSITRIDKDFFEISYE